MQSDRDLLKQALEALETCSEDEWYNDDDFGMVQVYDEEKITEAITALRERLAQPEQEPVVWHHPECQGECIACLIQRAVQDAYGTQGLDYLLRHVTTVTTQQPEQSRAEKMRDAGYTRRPTLREIAREDEQPEQEPVAHFGSAYVNENGVHITTVLGPVAIPQDAKLYTTPTRREWVGLTDKEIAEAGKLWVEGERMLPFAFASAIEAKLKEKNA